MDSFVFKAEVAGISMEEAVELKKKRTFRKFTFRGIDLDALLDKSRFVSQSFYLFIQIPSVRSDFPAYRLLALNCSYEVISGGCNVC